MFKLQIEQNALQDIQEITDWYNSQLKDLGARFQKQLKFQINSLKTNPHIYALRYANVHCLGVKKFPFFVTALRSLPTSKLSTSMKINYI